MYPRFIIPCITLTTFLLTTVLFAQPPIPNQSGFPDDPLGNLAGDFNRLQYPSGDPDMTPRTAMERAVQEAERAAQQPEWVPRGGESNTAPGDANSVSVAQLKHPLSRKGLKLIQKVQSYLKHGQKVKAKEQLAEAMNEPSAAPYAHAILGTEYLRDGQAADAVPELESAAQVLSISGVHSNLGYALCLTGHLERGRMELDEALRLDGDSAQARFLMGVVLLNQKSDPKKAEYNLKMAQDRVPSARLALAVCQILKGEKDAAEEQVHEFLGPKNQEFFASVWLWATSAAAVPHPAAAFGFRDRESD